tara:strand:- start:10323 stop:11018 length:696 start_codon:yes stop_codon:yes gene_type:complete
MKNLAFVPVRSGSTRLKIKALSKVQNETLLSLALKKAIKANIFDKVVCIGDRKEFKEIALENGIEYYDREPFNASSDAKSDEVVLETIEKINSKNIFWINITHPFTQISTIQKAFEILNLPDSKFDSVFTSHDWFGHASFNEKLDQPINYKLDNSFAQTQFMKKIVLLTYGIMAWDTKSFLSRYKITGAGILNGKPKTINVSRLESICIKYQDDLDMVNRIVSNKNIWNFV